MRLAVLALLLGLPGQLPAADPFDQSGVPLEVNPPPGFAGKKIVLIAGKKSHGPGDHEFFAGTALLMQMLKQSPGIWPVMVRDGWPKDETVFDNAACVMFYADGRGGHPAVQGERLKTMQKLIQKGVGWVNLHYAVDYLPKDGDTVMGWMGGYYDPRTSTNPHWDATIRSLPRHPVTRGVNPFTIRDEWYFNMHWLGDAPEATQVEGLTPILQALPPDNVRKTPDSRKYPGRIETLAWAYERPKSQGGGRGFGFTGGHTHTNWANADFRRVVVNGILWCANAEIPEAGTPVDLEPTMLKVNLDDKRKR